MKWQRLSVLLIPRLAEFHFPITAAKKKIIFGLQLSFGYKLQLHIWYFWQLKIEIGIVFYSENIDKAICCLMW